MSTYDEERAERMEYRRERAHQALRNAGMTDDVPMDTCGVTVLFWLIGLAYLLAGLAGKVTI